MLSEEFSHIQSLNAPHPDTPSSNPLVSISSSNSSQNDQAGELMEKVIKQMHQILNLQEQLHYYKSQFFRLARQDPPSSPTQDLQLQLQSKDTQIKTLQHQIESLKALKRVAAADEGWQKRIVEELRCQTRLVMELSSKNQKILTINAFLKEELEMAENKLVRLELQEQEKTCDLLLENVSRLKENQNLINNKHILSMGNWQTVPSGSSALAQSLLMHRQDTLKIAPSRYPYEFPFHKKQLISAARGKTGAMNGKISKLLPVEEPKPPRKTMAGGSNGGREIGLYE